MTYEEKIAAAQAKMDAFKAKMAKIGEKAKNARQMKREEISATIDSISADLDELDKALAEDEAKFEKASAEYETAIAEDYAKFDKAIADKKRARINGNINAAKENLRIAKERKDSKIYALKLKAQMRADVLKEKIADAKAEKDKAAMESYIVDLLEYADACQNVAFAAAIEADLTILEAAEVRADYIEKYGEPAPVEEAPAAE